MATPPPSPLYSRRRFLTQLLGTGAVAVTGLDSLLAQNGTASPTGAVSFRFAFLTDIHLMADGGLRSAEGLAACLDAVEKLDPRPEFILVGGDLVHGARNLTITEAESRLDLFLKIWNDHTSLPAHWTFGNHDLVGTSNQAVSPDAAHYGTGLFRDRFQLAQLFYSFDYRNWHFIVLNDIALQPDRSYIGDFSPDNLRFLQADLAANAAKPTLVCAHIPMVSALPISLYLAHAAGLPFQTPKNLVCLNGNNLFNDLPGHNIRAVLAGHLHHLEKMEMDGVQFINSGAVCGSYWKGPMLDCPEGFGVVDLSPDGTVAFNYRSYGWKA